jgi:hypothetical protein
MAKSTRENSTTENGTTGRTQVYLCANGKALYHAGDKDAVFHSKRAAQAHAAASGATAVYTATSRHVEGSDQYAADIAKAIAEVPDQTRGEADLDANGPKQSANANAEYDAA